MTAEGSGCEQPRNGIEHLLLRPGQGSALSLAKTVACNTNHVGHLEGMAGSITSCPPLPRGSAICSSGLTAA